MPLSWTVVAATRLRFAALAAAFAFWEFFLGGATGIGTVLSL